jgi:hypothetical protein
MIDTPVKRYASLPKKLKGLLAKAKTPVRCRTENAAIDGLDTEERCSRRG